MDRGCVCESGQRARGAAGPAAAGPMGRRGQGQTDKGRLDGQRNGTLGRRGTGQRVDTHELRVPAACCVAPVLSANCVRPRQWAVCLSAEQLPGGGAESDGAGIWERRAGALIEKCWMCHVCMV
jgi:hypothetical protein